MQPKLVVLTHRPCRDGFVAFICARKHYETNGFDNVFYWGVEPSKQVDDMKSLISKLDELAISEKFTHVIVESFDIAFNTDTIFSMLLNTSFTFDIKIYDHHRSAIDSWQVKTFEKTESWSKLSSAVVEEMSVNTKYTCRIKGKHDIAFISDLNECGASLAYSYYYKRPIPLFIEYVKDRDNWMFDTKEAKDRHSMEVNEYLMATSPSYTDYASWYKLLEEQSQFFDNAYQGGKMLLDMKDRTIRGIMSNGTNRMIDNYMVFVCNCPIYVSDIGNIAVNEYKEENGIRKYQCDYAMIWRYDEVSKKYYVSLRSRKGSVDVQEICKRYGGGGHASASGFETSNMTFLNL